MAAGKQRQDPSYYQLVGAGGPREVQETEHAFHLHMFQILEGHPGANQTVVVGHSAGAITAVDWIVCDGPDRNRANIVARVQGMKITRGRGYFLTADILFIDERFKDSTLKVVGSFRNQEDGELAIVGGSGEFSNALGSFNYKVTEFVFATSFSREINIHVFCRSIPKPPTPPTKFGPFGGNGGDAVDITQPPQRLESVTVRSGDVLDSFAFSYIDLVGRKQTAGPWGGKGGLPQNILFSPQEILKKVFGTTSDFGGNIVVTSITFVTSIKTYGPYGKGNGTPFSLPDKDNNHQVVGFFGRSGLFVDALGVYVSPAAPAN